MRLFAWFRAVVVATGEEDPVPIALERLHDGYAFRVGLRAGLGGQETARVRVRQRRNPNPHPIVKEIYSCEVAGQLLEAANVHALRAKAAVALDKIAPARTLPLCWFGASAYELAVYEQGGDIVCPLLSGPKLKARDLAGIRRLVCAHLVSAGYADDPEDVAVGVLQPRDLRRVRPAAIFRSHAHPDVWLPAVEGISAIGVLDHAFALSGRPRRDAAWRAEVPVAPDVIALLRMLRGEWARRRRLAHPQTLYAAEVAAPAWAAAEERTHDAGTRLIAQLDDADATRLELPVRRTGAGDVATALEERGITVLLAADEQALAVAVGEHLAAGEFLHDPQAVEVQTVAAPRAERLDADPNRTEEAHA